MKTTNYQNTLITVSADCARQSGTVPQRAGTIAALQHQLLAAAPYELTSDDLLWAVEVMRNDDMRDAQDARDTFFSSSRACLRASPLVKSFGWGLYHDAKARIALISCDSGEYQALLADQTVTKVAGLRSRR